MAGRALARERSVRGRRTAVNPPSLKLRRTGTKPVEAFGAGVLRTAKPCGPGARGWRQVGGGVASPTGRANAANSPMTEARGIRLRGEHGISRKTTVQGMPECSDCTCMLVCAFLRTYCTRDRGCSKHPAFPAPSFWAKRFAKPGRNAPREGEGVCPTVIAEDGFSGRVDRSRRNASSDIRPIIRGAPSRHSEECRQHQSRHEQNH